MFDNLSTEQLREELRVYNAAQDAKAEEAVPLPAQANRAAMTPAQQESAFDAWVSWINSRSNGTWTADEKAAIRFGIGRALKTL